MTRLVVAGLLVTALLLLPWRRPFLRAAPAHPAPGRRPGWGIVGRRRDPAHRRKSDVAVAAEFAELLSLCLAAGLDPDTALTLATGSGRSTDPRRARLASLLEREPPGNDDIWAPPAGRSVPERDVELARTGLAPTRPAAVTARVPEPDAPDAGVADLLTRAWWMSRERGSPLTAVVSTCAAALRSADAADRRRRAAEAGPRASMWLLTALPLVGPGVAALVGVDLVQAYTAPAAIASCALGLLLTTVGWWWARRMLRRASLPVRHQ